MKVLLQGIFENTGKRVKDSQKFLFNQNNRSKKFENLQAVA